MSVDLDGGVLVSSGQNLFSKMVQGKGLAVTSGSAAEQRLVITIDGERYDVTEFQERHPGGPEVLAAAAELEDAGERFKAVGHSPDAVAQLAQLRVDDDKVSPFADEGRQYSDAWLYSAAVGSSLVWAFFVNLTSQSGAGWWEDFTRQYPDSGESGYGRFELRGYSLRGVDYKWRLATCDRALGIALSWTLYIVHQVSQWAIMWLAQREKDRRLREEGVPRWSNGLDRYNWAMFASNVLGYAGHWAVCMLTYESLSGTTNEALSQNSVILFLGIVIMMEQRRRGLVAGRGRSFPCARETLVELERVAKRYHGYVFSWAFVYTFHYQAIESTSSHLGGYFYMALLMFQSNLLFHNAHRNRSWTFWLEALVLLHAILVAVLQGPANVMQFGFGFLVMTLFNQLPGVPAVQQWLFPDGEPRASKRNVLATVGTVVLFAGAVIGCYFGGLFGESTPVVIVFIPAAFIMLYIVLLASFSLAFALYRLGVRSWLATRLMALLGLFAGFVVTLALVGGGGGSVAERFAIPECGFLYVNGTRYTEFGDLAEL